MLIWRILNTLWGIHFVLDVVAIYKCLSVLTGRIRCFIWLTHKKNWDSGRYSHFWTINDPPGLQGLTAGLHLPLHWSTCCLRQCLSSITITRYSALSQTWILLLCNISYNSLSFLQFSNFTITAFSLENDIPFDKLIDWSLYNCLNVFCFLQRQRSWKQLCR